MVRSPLIDYIFTMFHDLLVIILMDRSLLLNVCIKYKYDFLTECGIYTHGEVGFTPLLSLYLSKMLLALFLLFSVFFFIF